MLYNAALVLDTISAYLLLLWAIWPLLEISRNVLLLYGMWPEASATFLLSLISIANQVWI